MYDIHTRTRNFGKICTITRGTGTAFSYCRPQTFVRMRVRVRIRVHVTGGVLQIHLTYVGRLSEQPHWRSLAVAKTRCSGGQTKVQQWPNKVHLRAEWPLQGVPSEKLASGRCSPISTNHVALFGLSCTRLGLVSTLHLALAIFQQGAPCFGHCPKKNMCVFKAGTTVCRISICVRESSTSLQHIRVAWMGQDYT